MREPRMLALALVMEGENRETAARQCGMDRQTLRDWVHRYVTVQAFPEQDLDASQLGVVFLCVSWAATSASGWRGRTERRRKRRRRSSFPTLRSCNSTLNSRAILWRRSITRQRTTPSVSRSGPVRTHSANVASCAGVSLETAPPPCGRSDKPVTPAAL